MLNSMTAIATAQGARDGHAWSWELRGVNGKGLDLRLRLPDWIEGLEAPLRARLTAALSRGNVTLTLRVRADGAQGDAALDPAALDRALEMIRQVEARALEKGLSLAPARAADILGLRGVLDAPGTNEAATTLAATLLEDFEAVLGAFGEMRAAEGRALRDVLDGQVDEIARLTDAAAEAAEARAPEMAEGFRNALARVLDNANGADEQRVAQELAVMAVKADVTEEIDRLRAHVGAARELLAQGSPVGRKLDFLAQEFNREANTLCSKAQNKRLTAVGLELKSAIEQMREQVQNVE